MTPLFLRYPMYFIFAILLISVASCSKKDKTTEARLQVRLTDNPPADIKEVWVDIRQVEIIVNNGDPYLLPGVHQGLYNLLDLTNGKDTLLADAMIPTGNISQLRLILGDNNFLVSHSGEKLALKTPSAQQSGLKVQIHQELSGGILYRLILDFDVARSIVQAGNSGNIILKPVLRIISFVPSGGDIRGVVLPGIIPTAVYAIQGIDTIATSFTATPAGQFLIRDIPAGNYQLYFLPAVTTYQPVKKNAVVVLGQVTVTDTIRLQQ